MKMLSITLKDLQIFFKDRGAILYLFLLPVVFVTLYAGIGSVTDAGGEDRLIPLPVVNLDPGGQKADELIGNMRDSTQVEVTLYEEAEARELITGKEIEFILFIPENFTNE